MNEEAAGCFLCDLVLAVEPLSAAEGAPSLLGLPCRPTKKMTAGEFHCLTRPSAAWRSLTWGLVHRKFQGERSA